MYEFDWILDSEDVFKPLVVDVIHHCRQRRGLTGAGRPGHQYDTAWLVSNLLEACRAAQFLKRKNG